MRIVQLGINLILLQNELTFLDIVNMKFARVTSVEHYSVQTRVTSKSLNILTLDISMVTRYDDCNLKFNYINCISVYKTVIFSIILCTRDVL